MGREGADYGLRIRVDQAEYGRRIQCGGVLWPST